MPTRCDALTRTALGSEWMGGAPIDLNAEIPASLFGFFFSSRRRHTRWNCDWSSDVCSSDLTGYLLKEISTDEVATAIRAVADGQSQISPSMASKLLTEFKSMIQRTDERRLVPAPRLTDRELEVLKLVATGMNNRDIAKELFISENTVKNHVRNILEKLQLHSRMEAVVYAMREKILEIR